MPKELWEKIKEANRKPREIVYAKDANGKDIVFEPKPGKTVISKHQGSKRGQEHTPKYRQDSKRGDGLTNHERVIKDRAKKQGISVAEYKRRWCAS